ncbi:hypothetical protein Hanom_Chr10g00965161 [Helianthus anomalus]
MPILSNFQVGMQIIKICVLTLLTTNSFKVVSNFDGKKCICVKFYLEYLMFYQENRRQHIK